MQKAKGFLKKICTPFLLISLILCLSFSIRTALCEELQSNKALDEKVRMFLENRKGKWHDWNIPYPYIIDEIDFAKICYNVVDNRMNALYI